jgi:hypothetical protein
MRNIISSSFWTIKSNNNLLLIVHNVLIWIFKQAKSTGLR